MKAFELIVATDTAEALAAGATGHTYKAGGIDLLDRLKERVAAPSKLVSVNGISDLSGVAADGAGLRLGPTTTLAALAADPSVTASFSALGHAAGEAATPQIRNMATVAGNLCQRPRCWYFRSQHFHCLKKGGATCFAVDGEHDAHALFGGGPCHIVHPSNIAPSLVAADATFLLRQQKGKRQTQRWVGAEEFFVLPASSLGAENKLQQGELMTSIKIPRLPEASGYAEVRHKQSFDWPLATATAVRLAGRWRVVLGSVAPIPWRAKAAEAVLAKAGAKPTDSDIAAAAKAATSGATPLPRAKWRLELVEAVVRRALVSATGGAP